MKILNLAGYKFIPLHDLATLQDHLLHQCRTLGVKGTILLSTEGININLAGTISDMAAFKTELKSDTRFADMSFHETYSATLPFKTLKVKLKKEIITLRKPEATPIETRAPSITPELLKEWLDEKRDITLLDTRNDYEVRFGTFTGATHLNLKDFGELPNALQNIPKTKPIVMFCTGGIRCEKAALYMQHQGYMSLYQLEGGILGYFANVGGAHYEGECFVFDERVAVDAHLHDTGTLQCKACQGPVTDVEQTYAEFIPGVSCPACIGSA
jgi:UPF0176 protein